MKVTGLEWKRFYSDDTAWPEGAWHDDEKISVDGKPHDYDLDLSRVPDAAVLNVTGGVVYMNESANEGPSLVAHFKRWRKRQTTSVLVVEVSHEAEDAVREAIDNAGGRLLAAR